MRFRRNISFLLFIIIMGLESVMLPQWVRGQSLPVAQNPSAAQIPASTSKLPADFKMAQSEHLSRNWSGYTASEGTFTGAGASWIVPKITDTNSFGADATWVGIGGVESRDLIQTGTQATVDRDGTVTYESFYEMLPEVSQPLEVKIKGGDMVSAAINQIGNGNWTINFKNKTSGENKTIVLSYDSSLSSADWIQEAPSGRRRVIPLDNFGTVRFKDAYAVRDGKKISINEANGKAIMMGDIFGNKLADTSTLGEDGASFSVVRAVPESGSDSGGGNTIIIRIPLIFRDIFKRDRD